MERIIYSVSFEIMTTKYRSVATDLNVAVVGSSFDDVAQQMELSWGQFKGFNIKSISPVGSPIIDTIVPLLADSNLFS